MLPANHQIVALAHQRQKTETERASRGARGDAGVRRAGLNLPGGRQMTLHFPFVALHLAVRNSQSLQVRVQQIPAARSSFAIHDAHIGPSKIFDAMQTLGIASRGYDTLFPHRET